MGIIIFVAFLPEKVQLFVLFLGSQEAGMFRKELTEARLSAHEPLHSPLVAVRPAAQHLRWWLQFDKAREGLELRRKPRGRERGESSRPLIAVSHHAIDPPGSFRCLHRFHNSLIPANLRDKLRGVESVNGAPWFWNPVAGSFFTSPPASFTAGILPQNVDLLLQLCVSVCLYFGMCVVDIQEATILLQTKRGLLRVCSFIAPEIYIFEFSVLRYLTW